MSALWPHIRALRAEAKGLYDTAAQLGDTPEQTTTKFTLVSMAAAKVAAADELEAGMREMIERVAAQPVKES